MCNLGSGFVGHEQHYQSKNDSEKQSSESPATEIASQNKTTVEESESGSES